MNSPIASHEQTAQTPIDDLERDALAHYEDVSLKARHWMSVIPRAIRFYYDAQRRANPETQAPVDAVPVATLSELEAEFRAVQQVKGKENPAGVGYIAGIKWCADRLSAVIRGTKT